MVEQQWRQDPADEGRPATEQELAMIIGALDILVAQPGMLGNFAIINLDKGGYVTARTLTEAINRFQRTFPDARGFVRCVGEPLHEPVLL
jgi:hypothetical protein